MSTFTEWNGAGGSHGPSTRDITGLIDAYTNLKNSLDRHINDDIKTNNAHRGKDYVEEVKLELANIINNQIFPQIRRLTDGKADKPASGHYIDSNEAMQYATHDELADELAEYYKKSEMTTMLTGYVKTEGLESLSQIVGQNKALFDQFVNYFDIENDPLVLVCKNVLGATEYLLGALHARRVIDFTEWQTVAMQFAGTGAVEDANTNGLYVIGKLSDDWSDDSHAPSHNVYKSARAFVKYEDGAPFDAIIDMVVTKHGDASFTGAMNAIVSKQPGEWNNLRFHLVRATGYDGKESIYLCVSADGLAKNDSNYANWYIHACGINFIPLDDKAVSRVTKVDDCICSTGALLANQGSGVIASNISVGELNLDIIRDSAGNIMLQMQHIVDDTGVDHRHLLIGDPTIKAVQIWKRPTILSIDPEHGETIIEDKLATVKDLQSLAGVPLGGEIYWPLYEEVPMLDDEGNPVLDDEGNPIIVMRRAIEVPEGFLACDGSSVFSVDYSDFSKVMHHENDDEFNLPLHDCAIIKVKKDTDEGGDDDDPERITVLNYNQIVELLKNTSKYLKEEIERSTTADQTHDDVLGEHDRILDSHDQSIDNLNTSVNGVSDALDAEINRSVAKDNEHDSKLDSHDASINSLSATADNLNTAVNNVAAALDTEIARATQAETDEATRAQTAEQELMERVNNRPTKAQVTAQIQAETDRAVAEEQRIEAKIGDEIDRSTTRDEAHDGLIGKIETTIDELHVVDWNRWKDPVTVTSVPTGAEMTGYAAGDRIYVTTENKRYYLKQTESGGVVSLNWVLVGTGPWE